MKGIIILVFITAIQKLYLFFDINKKIEFVTQFLV